MKSKKVLWGALGAVALAAIGAAVVFGSGALADPPDPRTQTVSWGFNQDYQQNAMHLSVTSDAPVDKRIVTTVTRAADGLLVVGKDTESAYYPDPADMGEPGSPLTTSDTVLTLDSHPTGTAFTITTQFYDALGTPTGTKVSTWTKP